MAGPLFLKKYYEFDVKKREERENMPVFFRPMERSEKRTGKCHDFTKREEKTQNLLQK